MKLLRLIYIREPKFDVGIEVGFECPVEVLVERCYGCLTTFVNAGKKEKLVPCEKHRDVIVLNWKWEEVEL